MSSLKSSKKAELTAGIEARPEVSPVHNRTVSGAVPWSENKKTSCVPVLVCKETFVNCSMPPTLNMAKSYLRENRNSGTVHLKDPYLLVSGQGLKIKNITLKKGSGFARFLLQRSLDSVYDAYYPVLWSISRRVYLESFSWKAYHEPAARCGSLNPT